MFLTNASVKRPAAMTALILAFVIIGIYAYTNLNLEFIPKIEAPIITVSTVYPGCAPKEMESLVTKRIEDAVSEVSGIKKISSYSMESLSQVVIELNLGRNVDFSAIDIREKIELIKNDLPDDCENPQVLKIDLNALPVMNLAVFGNRDIEDLYQLADTDIKDALMKVNGLAQIDIVGGAKRQILVLLSQEKLAARGLVISQVFEAIAQANRNVPSGHITEMRTEFLVRVDSEIERIEEIENLEISTPAGKPVKLKDIGRVVDSREEQRQSAYFNGEKCLGLSVIKQSDANIVEVVEHLQKKLPDINRLLPEGVEIREINNAADFVKDSVNDVMASIFIGIGLTALVLYLFLHTIRQTIIVAVTMPVSVISTFMLIMAAGFTLNIMTLMALGLAIGTLVDNSVVVLESIHRHRMKGKPLRDASVDGVREIALGVTASAATNIVVFVPIAFIGGVVGMLVSPFALTMAFVTLMSLFISFTLTPIFTSLFLEDTKEYKKTDDFRNFSTAKDKPHCQVRFSNAWENGFSVLENKYRLCLKSILSNRMITISLVIGLFLGSLTLAQFLGTTMIPTPDRGEVTIQFEMPPGTPMNVTSDLLMGIETSVRERCGDMVRAVYVTTGKITARAGRTSEGTHVGELLVLFTDKNKRAKSMPEILHELQDLKKETPGVVTILQTSPMGGTESPIQIDVYGDDLVQIDAYTKELESRIHRIPGAVSIDSTVRPGKPEIAIFPEKDRLTDSGFTSVGLGMVVRMNLEGMVASAFRDKGSEYDIVVQLDESDLDYAEEVGDMVLQSISSIPLPVETVSRIENRTSSAQIIRRDKRRIQNLSCDSSGRSMGEVIADIRREAQNMNMKAGYGIMLSGQAEEMGDMFVKMVTVMVLAVILTYLTLVAILESYIQPFTILLTFPLSIIGVLGALYVTHNSLGLFSMMGIVMLLGIVVNNGILIIDYTTTLRAQGAERREALLNACRVRLRPIMMTTLTTVFGMLPIALGMGWGAELRAPMAIVAIGGLLVSTVLTAFVIPVVYTIFDDIASLGRKLLGSS